MNTLEGPRTLCRATLSIMKHRDQITIFSDFHNLYNVMSAVVGNVVVTTLVSLSGSSMKKKI
jgi:hypothetical protein